MPQGQIISVIISVRKTKYSVISRPVCFNAALAMALAGDYACLPKLFEMMKNTSPAEPESSRKYNYPYALSAISALGKLKCEEVLPQLCDILACRVTYSVKYSEFMEDDEDIRFEYFLHAMVAICEICGDFKKYEKIRSFISNIIYDTDFKLTVSGKANKYKRIDYTETVRRYFESHITL